MLKVFEGAKIEKVGTGTLDIVRRNGTDISYTTEDQHIEAYAFAGHIYIVKVTPAGPRE
jgi:hypothetical protein